MDENRASNIFTTPTGRAVNIKTYLTARERNALRSVFLESVSVDPGSGTPKIADLGGPLLEKSEAKLIELAVISYDGSTENILGRLLDGTPEDYDFVVAESNKIGNFTRPK